ASRAARRGGSRATRASRRGGCRARLASHARKPVDEQTAAQKGAEFPFDETGQVHAVGTRSRFRQERLQGGINHSEPPKNGGLDDRVAKGESRRRLPSRPELGTLQVGGGRHAAGRAHADDRAVTAAPGEFEQRGSESSYAV